MRDPRLTERRNPRSAAIDTATSLEIVDLMSAEDLAVPAAVARAREPIARTMDLIEAAFRAGGRLFYVGAGTSGRLGVLDASECPPTFGSPPEMVQGIIAGGLPALVTSVEGAEDDLDAAIRAIEERQVTANDVVVGIAASGTTPFVQTALGRARTLGAATIFLSCSNPPQAMVDACDVCITVPVGPEVVTGSTRLKAGTATKLVLNILTTGAMLRLGKSYGNLMVDMQVKNQKLSDRGERIVMEVAAVGRDAARAAIASAGGSVRTAIVMLRVGVDRAEAERQIAAADGRLRAVIGDPPPVGEV